MVFEYLLSVGLLVDVIFIGLLITYFFKLEFYLEARFAVGALIGLVVLGGFMLLISFFLGLNFFGLAIFLGIANFFGYLLIKDGVEKIKKELSDFKHRFRQWEWKIYFLFMVFFAGVFGYLAYGLLTFNEGSYYVQPTHAYGDISLHLGIISSFAFGNNFPPKSPILAEIKISYPFLVDFITAIFVNPLHLRLDQAVSLTGVLLMIILVIILAYFALKVTGSKLASCLFSLLLFFNGGLGFVYFFRDLQISNSNFFQFIQVLPRDYTALKDLGIWWINVVISMLLPQRSFLLGLPLVILILYIFWDLPEQFDTKKLFLGILLLSLLPIIHAHSLIVLAPFLLWFIPRIILKNRKRIGVIFLLGLMGMATIFLLSKLFLEQSENPLSLIRFNLGWMARPGQILIFYFQNFGFNLILIPAAIFLGLSRYKKLAYFALIGQLWFILPSLFIFQPWNFDNTKFFIFWYLSSMLILGYLLSKIILTRQISSIILAGTIIYVLILSGFLDITRLMFSSGTRYAIYSPQAIKLAEFIKNNTKQDAVFLSVDKFDNPVVTLAGRREVAGYHAWLWSYGLDYSQKEADVKMMLSGQGSQDLFKKYNISYVILFDEQSNFIIDKNYFSQYNLIYKEDGYTVYQI